MKIKEVVEKMTKRPLGRIVSSIGEYKPDTRKERRKIILKNKKSFTKKNSIKSRLKLKGEKIKGVKRPRVLMEIILKILLDRDDNILHSSKLENEVREYEEKIVDEAEEVNLHDFLEKKKIENYENLVKVAFDDDELSFDEYKLIERFRKDQKINKKLAKYIEVRMKKYPRPITKNSVFHTHSDFRETIKQLQKKGIVFKFEEGSEKRILTIPDELIEGVKVAIDYELNEESHKTLLGKLKFNHLKSIARSLNIKGFSKIKRKTLIEKIMLAGYKPSKELDTLNITEIENICKDLELKSSGNKNKKIKRIVDYLFKLEIKKPRTDDPREKYYLHFRAIAARKGNDLLNAEIIDQYEDLGSVFEEATVYIFDKLLDLKVKKLGNLNEADGQIIFDDEILLWDNKSTEKDYKFSNKFYRQFLRYISDSKQRVKVFLIIVNSFKNKEQVKTKADKLKNKCESDTDIALITAENLKYIAEEWKDKNDKSEFDLAIFNKTGIIERSRIERYKKKW